MPDEYLETKAELTAELNPKKKKKKKHAWWDNLLLALAIAASTALVATAIHLGYLRIAYGYTFFVDGASMYPTLNGDGFSKRSDGTYTPITWKSGNQKVGDLVDYGWSKLNIDLKKDLKRFDIITTYYSSDLNKESDGTYKPRDNAFLKIKRLIAFPGETVQLTPDKDGDKFLTPWGTLTITSVTGEVSVYPSYYSFDDYPDVDGKTYESMLSDENQTYGPKKLADNEYFVLGDNRASNFSGDSRHSTNHVYDYCIMGKACVVTSLQELKKNGNNYDTSFRIDKLRMFWDYIYLDGSAVEKTKKETANA